MKNIFLFMIFLVSLSFAGSNVSLYLPNKGTIHSNSMIVGFPEKMQVILKKYGESVKKNEKWFKEYEKQYKGIFPMPFHKNMGLTEKEYEEFKGLGSSMTLIKNEKITLSVTYDTNGTIFSVENNPNHFLDGLRIYKDGTVKTKLGILTTFEDVNR